MKPAAFSYRRAYCVDEAIALLAGGGDEAKVLAGGQSLVPMMNFRLARPSMLIDINRVGELSYVRREGDELRVGALVRHREIETARDPDMTDGFGLLPRAARWIGHYPIRTRGTVGGSVAHADSTAEWCLMASLFDAEVVLAGAAGERRVAAADWFEGFLSTAIQPGEVVKETVFRQPRAYGALREYARRQGDFAIAAAAVSADIVDGVFRGVRVVFGGVASVPHRSPIAEAMLEGSSVADAAQWAEVARAAAALLRPMSDLHGDADYRRDLAATLLARAIADTAQGGVVR